MPTRLVVQLVTQSNLTYIIEELRSDEVVTGNGGLYYPIFLLFKIVRRMAILPATYCVAHSKQMLEYYESTGWY